VKGIDFTGVAILLGLAAAGAGALYIFNKRKAIGAALDITAPTNLASRFVENAITQATGTPDSLGTWLAGKLSPAARAAERALAAPVILGQRRPFAAAGGGWEDSLGQAWEGAAAQAMVQ